MSSNVVTVIPAAGYGTRMGMKEYESKEMLIDPKTGEPIIQWCLDFVKNPLVITRPEKKDLIYYCIERGIDVSIINVKKESLWTDTIIRGLCKNYYKTETLNSLNELSMSTTYVLVLPDTRFKPEIYKKVIESSYWHPVFATHKVSDPEKWGIVTEKAIYEKYKLNGEYDAWGIISAPGPVFARLLEEMNSDGVARIAGLNEVIPFHKKIPMEYFEDITRDLSKFKKRGT